MITEFRGKTKYSPQWVFGSLINNVIALTGEHDINGQITIDNKTPFTAIVDGNGCIYEIDPETKGQYIGRKDKNNVKIYDGDKLLFIFPNKKTVKITVKWDAQLAGFQPFLQHYWDCGVYNYYDSSLSEVIGNLHDDKVKE